MVQNLIKILAGLRGGVVDLLAASPGVYLVGGCVRDALTGIAPADYDLAVAEDPPGFASRLARAAGSRVVTLGRPGTQVYRVPYEKQLFDVSPLAGGTIEADLGRRDFTINAMAYAPASARLIDPFGGRRDLGRRVRMVSESVFRQDPLRMLRAFRLAAGLGLAIDRETLAAVQTHRERIRTVAGERIREECLKFCRSDASTAQLNRMAETGLLETLLPELTPLRHCPPNRHHTFDPFAHTLAAYGHLEALLAWPGRLPEPVSPPISPPISSLGPKEAALLKWAMLLHDTGKPSTASGSASGEIHYYEHDRVGAGLAAGVCARFRFSKEETRFVEGVVRHHLGPLHLYLLQKQGRLTPRAVTRFFLRCGESVPHILIHALADHLGKGRADPEETGRFQSFLRLLADRFHTGFKATAALPPLITGHDLIRELGLAPSPVFKDLLAAVTEARLAGSIRTRREALRLAADLLPKMDAT